MTQCERIIRHLNDYKTITALEAMNEYGIMRLAARISDLERMGYQFDRMTLKGQNRYGEPTHWVQYSLVDNDGRTSNVR